MAMGILLVAKMIGGAAGTRNVSRLSSSTAKLGAGDPVRPPAAASELDDRVPGAQATGRIGHVTVPGVAGCGVSRRQEARHDDSVSAAPGRPARDGPRAGPERQAGG